MHHWRDKYLKSFAERLSSTQKVFVPLSGTLLEPKTRPSADIFEIRGQVSQTDVVARVAPSVDALGAIFEHIEQGILVLGDPGSGKTTLLERVAHELVRRAASNPTRRVPVLVQLRSLASSLLELVATSLATSDGPATTQDVEVLLARGELIIMFDGLNEASDQLALRRKLTQFKSRWSSCPMLFSGRRQTAWDELETYQLSIDPLNSSAMAQLAVQFGASADALAGFEGLSTPLLVRLACVVVNVELGDDLRIRTEGDIYRVFSERYGMREAIPAGEAERFGGLCRPALTALAAHQCRSARDVTPRLVIDYGEALEVVSSSLRTLSSSERSVLARPLLQHLLDWHLLQRREKSVEFVHHRFLEYFASEALLELAPRIPDDVLKWNYLNNEVWTEPLYLAASISRDSDLAERLIEIAGKLNPIVADRATRRTRAPRSDSARREKLRSWHTSGGWAAAYTKALRESEKDLDMEATPGHTIGMYIELQRDAVRAEIASDALVYDELEQLCHGPRDWRYPGITAFSAKEPRASETTYLETPSTMRQPRGLFVSYASEDIDRVKPFVDALKTAGLKPWFDRDNLESGVSIPERVEAAIDNASAMVVFHSAHYAVKHWGNEEWRAFLNRKLAGQTDRRLFVYRLDHEDELPSFLAHRLWRADSTPYEFATDLSDVLTVPA